MKRYTTHGMATDQGRIGGLVGQRHARGGARRAAWPRSGSPSRVPTRSRCRSRRWPARRCASTSSPSAACRCTTGTRPPARPSSSTGLWLRPLVYSRESRLGGGARGGARACARQVGITDVSTLGKIDVQGPDAAQLPRLHLREHLLDAAGRPRALRHHAARGRHAARRRHDLAPGARALPRSRRPPPTRPRCSSTWSSSCRRNCPHLRGAADRRQRPVGAVRRRRAACARGARRRASRGLDLSNAAFPFMAAAPRRSRACRAGSSASPSPASWPTSSRCPRAMRTRGLDWRCSRRASRYGIRPYGLDALNTLRIEKGHVTGAELNGNTSADDLGFAAPAEEAGRLHRPRAGAAAGAAVAPERLQLVGVRPSDRARRLRNGTQLVSPRAPDTPASAIVTSCTPSVELEGWVGLALLADGRRAHRARACTRASPVHAEQHRARIVSPHMRRSGEPACPRLSGAGTAPARRARSRECRLRRRAS